MDGKFRILALHGGVSNSNIMRFQASRLRKLLGASAAEWTVPDAPGRWAPIPIEDAQPDSVYAAYSAERSSVEKILAKGAPFCEWFAFGLDQKPVRASYDEGWRWLLEYVKRSGPFHLVIAFGQSTQVANRVSEELRRQGEEQMWRLNLFFNADPPLPWETEEELYRECLPHATLLVHSPADTTHTYEEWLPFYRRIFTDFHLCEHDEGRAWPMREPRASQIYAEVVEWLRSHVGEETLLARELPAPSAVAGADWHRRPPPGRTTREPCAQDHSAAPGGRPAVSASRAQERVISPDELADLLLARQCVVVDTRDFVGSRMPFPGAWKQDVSSRTLEMGLPSLWRQRLAYLRADGRRLVAVSEDGGLCREYCELLVERLGFPAQSVYRLRGGVSGWHEWESTKLHLCNEIRSMYGLPPRSRGSAVETIEPEELAQMLRSFTCQVLDTRELAESRGRAFPGAHKNVSFLTLRRSPSTVLEKLRRMAGCMTTRFVAVSATGLRCEAYCRLLLEKLGRGCEHGDEDDDQWLRSSLCRLAGGLLAWDSWARENGEVAEELCSQYGLPTAARGRALVPCSDMGAAAREHSMELLQ